jgi:hypothetical protein
LVLTEIVSTFSSKVWANIRYYFNPANKKPN